MAGPEQRRRQVDLLNGGWFTVVAEQWLMPGDLLHHFNPLVVYFLTFQFMLSHPLQVGIQLSWDPIEDFPFRECPGGEAKMIQTPGLKTWLRVSA